MTTPICFIDTETTSLRPDRARAAVAVSYVAFFAVVACRLYPRP